MNCSGPEANLSMTWFLPVQLNTHTCLKYIVYIKVRCWEWSLGHANSWNMPWCWLGQLLVATTWTTERMHEQESLFCEGDWALEQVSQRSGGVSFPTDMWTLGTTLSNVLRGLYFSGEAGLDDLQLSLPTLTITWFCNVMAVMWTTADLHPGLAKFTSVGTAGEHSQWPTENFSSPQTDAGLKMVFEVWWVVC